MSTPGPPDQWGQAWSQDPPTEQFAAQDPYGASDTPDPAYSDPAYSDQTHPGQEHYPPPAYVPPAYTPQPPSRTPMWAWVLLGLVIAGLLGGLGYFVVTQVAGSKDPVPAAARPVTESEGMATTAPRPATTSARPSPTATPRATVPANALSCSGGGSGAFATSAVAGNTSCPFAESVRKAYTAQPQRNGAVSVQAWSPTTKQWYAMSCAGADVVMCTGGKDAVVYVY